MEKLSLAVVGAGWRGLFFVRIALALPHLFHFCGVIERDKILRDSVHNEFGVPIFADADQLLKTEKPDFVVLAVSYSNMAEVAEEWADLGIPLLMETPPAPSIERLNSLYLKLRSHKVQVAEQYQFQPMHSARLKLIEMGLLGDVYSARVGFNNKYHSISILRLALKVGFRLPSVYATRYSHQMTEGPGRGGDPVADRLVKADQLLFNLDYGDCQGISDTEDNQHRSWIRFLQIVIRGTKGEICNDEILYLRDYLTPCHLKLDPVRTGTGGNMEGMYLRGIRAGNDWVYKNPFGEARLYDDEIAVAECMYRMKDYLLNDVSFYSLADACHDQYLSILCEESIKLDKKVQAEPQQWCL